MSAVKKEAPQAAWLDPTIKPPVDPGIINIDPEYVSGQPAFPKDGMRVMVYLLRDYLICGRTIDDFLRDMTPVSRQQVLNVLELVFARTIGPADA